MRRRIVLLMAFLVLAAAAEAYGWRHPLRRGPCLAGMDCWSACENTCANDGGLIAACECSWLGNDCGCLCANSGGFSCEAFPGCQMAPDYASRNPRGVR